MKRRFVQRLLKPRRVCVSGQQHPSLRAHGTWQHSLLPGDRVSPGALCPRPRSRPRGARVGQSSASAAPPPRAGARCRPGTAPRDTPSPDLRPPAPPLPPRTHTGHPSVLRAEQNGGAGLAARPPGPGSAASSGAGRGGKGRDGKGRTPRPRPRRARHEQGERRLERGRPGPESRGQRREG